MKEFKNVNNEGVINTGSIKGNINVDIKKIFDKANFDKKELVQLKFLLNDLSDQIQANQENIEDINNVNTRLKSLTEEAIKDNSDKMILIRLVEIIRESVRDIPAIVFCVDKVGSFIKEFF